MACPVSSAVRNTGTLTDVLAERARAELGDVSDHELLYMITGLIFAGQVTTESFLGFLLAHQLAGHLDAGTGDAGTVDAFVTEALRLHPPHRALCTGPEPPASARSHLR